MDVPGRGHTVAASTASRCKCQASSFQPKSASLQQVALPVKCRAFWGPDRQRVLWLQRMKVAGPLAKAPGTGRPNGALPHASAAVPPASSSPTVPWITVKAPACSSRRKVR